MFELGTNPSGVSAMGDVCGTAFWIAHYRALEREQAAPLFHDPWAGELAGDRGRTIVEHLRGARRMAWVFAIRTAVLDQMIASYVERNRVDLVINLAAGLDTRAFRLPLSAAVRWVDVDKPAIIEHKLRVLAGAHPRCQWQAVPLDLADASERRKLLEQLGQDAKHALVISEGLVIYLSEAEVATLARDVHAVPALRSWVFDLPSPATLQTLQRAWNRTMIAAGAAFRFGPVEGPAFFDPYGWKLAEHVSMFDEGLRRGRVPRLDRAAMALASWLAPTHYQQLARSGVTRLVRRGATKAGTR